MYTYIYTYICFLLRSFLSFLYLAISRLVPVWAWSFSRSFFLPLTLKEVFLPAVTCWGGSGVKLDLKTELVCSLPRRHPLQTSVSPLCFGLQTFLLFSTDPFPAFNKVFSSPHHLTLSTSILTFPKKNTTETKLLMGRNGATRDQPLPTLS